MCNHKNIKEIESKIPAQKLILCRDCKTLIIETLPHKCEWINTRRYRIDSDLGVVCEWVCSQCRFIAIATKDINPNSSFETEND